MSESFAVIAGGGTAGHLYPGLAIAEALVCLGKRRTEIHFFTSDRDIDNKLLTAANFQFSPLKGNGLDRRNILSSIKALTLLVKSTVFAYQYVRKSKPKVILSLGGFAAIPGSLAGLLTGTPVVLHEQNSVPGSANKLISKWVKKSAVSYKNTELPHSVYTGNPVRKEIADLSKSYRSMHRSQLGIPADNKLVVVTGGSLGSSKINKSILNALPNLEEIPKLTVYHIIGSRDWEELGQLNLEQKIDYRAIEYEEQMPMVLNSADLIISRAGGSIIAEINLLGLPSILIPLPNAPGDHQRRNAESLVMDGKAVIVSDENCTGERIAEEIKSIVLNEERLMGMTKIRHSKSEKNAAEKIASLLVEVAK
ncbi:undecaprenyldiphospho-muramoylpentapeptide beta-N-acetylglucosaminyltransferase [bacterium]|nr:undecaprenyldiphospho-muramoylpentapeptide beta-N-acetylglucosaminyltransferase [bacterium]